MTPKEKAKDNALRRVYGISFEQYRQLVDSQGGNCKICLRHESTFTKSLAVDHNHKTGEIRGVLCQYCNQRQVGRHTDATLLQRITDYVRDAHTGWFVPPKKKKKRKKKI